MRSRAAQDSLAPTCADELQSPALLHIPPPDSWTRFLEYAGLHASRLWFMSSRCAMAHGESAGAFSQYSARKVGLVSPMIGIFASNFSELTFSPS